MALENTPPFDGADGAGIARYIRASFAIVGNCVLCILHLSKRSKEVMTSTDLFSKSRSQASCIFLNCVAKVATHMHIVVILVMPFNVSRQSAVYPGERPVAVITPRLSA